MNPRTSRDSDTKKSSASTHEVSEKVGTKVTQQKQRPANEAPVAALDDYFGIFNSTITLVERLIKSKQQPQEILILLCSRLDALACSSIPERTPPKKAFSQFVASYGGYRDLLTAVSTGDLYYELAYYRWLLEGTIPKPGRIHKFSRLDEPIIHLLQEAGIPLTVKEGDRLLKKIMAALKRNYRKHLLARGKLPPDVYFHVFGDKSFQHLEFLDEDLLPQGGLLKLKISEK
jgi:hypothetical protein